MSRDYAGWSVIVGACITIMLVVSGLTMMSEPPDPADAAVGKGLLIIGICAGLVTAALLAYAVTSAPSRDRS